MLKNDGRMGLMLLTDTIVVNLVLIRGVGGCYFQDFPVWRVSGQVVVVHD